MIDISAPRTPRAAQKGPTWSLENPKITVSGIYTTNESKKTRQCCVNEIWKTLMTSTVLPVHCRNEREDRYQKEHLSSVSNMSHKHEQKQIIVLSKYWTRLCIAGQTRCEIRNQILKYESVCGNTLHNLPDIDINILHYICIRIKKR